MFIFRMVYSNRVIRYIFSGGVAVFSNLSVLFVLTEYCHLWYLFSAVIAFCCGVVVSYFLQKFFTFKDRARRNVLKQFTSFFLYSLSMLGLNTLLMYLFVDLIGLQYLCSQILISLGIAFINYSFFREVIFN